MLDAKHKSSYTIGMNKLDIKTRITILNLLVEGSSMRSISRIISVSQVVTASDMSAPCTAEELAKTSPRTPATTTLVFILPHSVELSPAGTRPIATRAPLSATR